MCTRVVLAATRNLLARPNPVLRLRGYASMTAEAFKKDGVVPDVIPEAPKETMIVKFGSGAEASLGNELKPRAVKDAPTSLSWAAEAGALYTLVVTDPDAPSRAEPKFREWHHWLVANIPENDVAKGDVFSAYIGAGPPEGTGLHRYVYLVYKQAGRVEDAEHGRLPATSADKRGGWKVASFAAKHGLGNPVAGNFFQAEWDDYVPELYKTLSG